MSATLRQFIDEGPVEVSVEDPERARRREEIRSHYRKRAALVRMCHQAMDEYVRGGSERHPPRNEEIEDLLIDIIFKIDRKAEETRRLLVGRSRRH